MHKALLRPLLEYASEVCSVLPWAEAEQLQCRMGKRILQCPPRTRNTVVRGELGWQSMEGRWLKSRLCFLSKLLRMPADSPARIVFDAARLMYASSSRSDADVAQLTPVEATDGWSMMRAAREDGGLTLWIAQLHLDCMHTGLAAEWRNDALITGDSHLQWKNRVATAVSKRESACFRRTIAHQSYPAVYQQVHTSTKQLTEAYYLRVPTHGWNDQRRCGRKVMTQLRCGTARLRVYTGAWEKESMAERICCTCAAAGSIDDEKHFLLHCTYYTAERAQYCSPASTHSSRAATAEAAARPPQQHHSTLQQYHPTSS